MTTPVTPPRHPADTASASTPLPVIPAQGNETELLTAFLDYQRAVVRRKAEGLTNEQLNVRLPSHPSTLTIGGVVKHLSWVEIKWSQAVFLGRDYTDIDEPWATHRSTDPHWEWDTHALTPQALLALYDSAITAATEAYDSAPPTQLSARAGCADPGQDEDDDATRYELRWILTHLIEEYARHAGHLDLLREHVDGATGN